MAKNLVNTSRNLKMIPDGPLAGFLHTDNPLGDPISGGELPLSMSYAAFTGSILSTVPTGFHQIVKPTNARLIYLADEFHMWNGTPVSPSDSNDGLSPLTPKKTAAAAAGLIRRYEGDILCVRRGEAVLWDFSHYTVRNKLFGGSLGARTYLAWYGSGSRPKVIPPTLDRGTHSHMGMVGIHWINPYKQLGSTVFDGVTSRNLIVASNSTEDILVEDCEFTGCDFVAQTNGAPFLRDITYNRNISHYCYWGNTATSDSSRPSGIYSEGVENLTITENFFKWSGWHPGVPAGWILNGQYVPPGTSGASYISGAASNMYNHGLYIQYENPHAGPLVRGNYFYEPSAHGAQLRSGGDLQENIVDGAAVGLTIGFTNVDPGGRLARMNRNIILSSQHMNRVDGGCQNGMCTGALWGIDFGGKPNANWVCSNNIVAGRRDPPLPILPGTVSAYAMRDNSSNPSPTVPSYISFTNNKTWHFEGNESLVSNASKVMQAATFTDPGRTPDAYFSQLIGQPITMPQVLALWENRGPYEWNDAFSHLAMHNWIEEGYEVI